MQAYPGKSEIGPELTLSAVYAGGAARCGSIVVADVCGALWRSPRSACVVFVANVIRSARQNRPGPVEATIA